MTYSFFHSSNFSCFSFLIYWGINHIPVPECLLLFCWMYRYQCVFGDILLLYIMSPCTAVISHIQLILYPSLLEHFDENCSYNNLDAFDINAPNKFSFKLSTLYVIIWYIWTYAIHWYQPWLYKRIANLTNQSIHDISHLWQLKKMGFIWTW